MSMNTAWLMWTVLFGSFGLAFFVYGRRQKAPVPLVCGLALMVTPYFLSNTYLLCAVGFGLIALPYFVRL